MSDKESAQNVIDSYRKRQVMAQKAPLIFGISAILLIVGAGAIILWLTGSDVTPAALFATQTPTPTETFTPTASPTVTLTPTETVTPTQTDTAEPTLTATASAPFIYTVNEGDTLTGIIERFGVDMQTVLALNPDLNPNLISPGQQLLIPSPDTQLPTATPVSETCRGLQNYVIRPGDSLADIANLFFSTVDAIVRENKLENANDINWGDQLKIPCGIATPAPTWTPLPAGVTPGAIMTLTPVPSNTASP